MSDFVPEGKSNHYQAVNTHNDEVRYFPILCNEDKLATNELEAVDRAYKEEAQREKRIRGGREERISRMLAHFDFELALRNGMPLETVVDMLTDKTPDNASELLEDMQVAGSAR